jgi:hypothetical protein
MVWGFCYLRIFKKLDSISGRTLAMVANEVNKFGQIFPIHRRRKYSRNVMDVDWGLVVKLALPAKVTRRANKVIGIYDRSHQCTVQS